jgi:hypothetical protein
MSRRHDTIFADEAAHDRECFAGGAHALYLEYVSELLKVPTLTVADEVVAVPREPLPADFRQGYRPDARKEARRDPYLARDERKGDLEELYAEYESGAAATTKKKTKRKKTRAQTPRAAAAKAPKGKRRKR